MLTLENRTYNELAIGERAELATDEYLPLTSVLEGVVILKKNHHGIRRVQGPSGPRAP